jgi:hypothetical protein
VSGYRRRGDSGSLHATEPDPLVVGPQERTTTSAVKTTDEINTAP